MSGLNFALIPGTVFAFLMPIALLVWWRKKTNAPIWAFVTGAICFIAFALVLESFVNSVVLSSGSALWSSPILFVVYTSLAAGIFEETGRLLGFRALMPNREEKPIAVAYGIGHGGIEAILTLGASYLVMLLAQLGVPMGETVTSAAGGISLGTSLTACLERCSALCLHIGLSMVVYAAAKGKREMKYYLMAILLHALADAPAAIYQYAVTYALSSNTIVSTLVFSNSSLVIAVIEIWALALGIFCLRFGMKLLYGNKTETVKEFAEKPAEEIADEPSEAPTEEKITDGE